MKKRYLKSTKVVATAVVIFGAIGFGTALPVNAAEPDACPQAIEETEAVTPDLEVEEVQAEEAAQTSNVQLPSRAAKLVRQKNIRRLKLQGTPRAKQLLQTKYAKKRHY